MNRNASQFNTGNMFPAIELDSMIVEINIRHSENIKTPINTEYAFTACGDLGQLSSGEP